MSNKEEEPVRLGFTDIVAIFIASAQVLFPFLLLLITGWGLFIWFSTSVWLK